MFKLVAHNVITNIDDTIKSIDFKTFSNAVDSIIAAQRINCLGIELSHHLSRLMTFLLRKYSYDARYLSTDFLKYREQIAYLTPKDLLIAFSFSPYSRETVEAVAFAREKVLKTKIRLFKSKHLAWIIHRLEFIANTGTI